ncbi:hypothetical protein CPB97_004100 [Podila verticillata]|nr:hypothetical protein CPB97_004100 [Podila verticillata]
MSSHIVDDYVRNAPHPSTLLGYYGGEIVSGTLEGAGVQVHTHMATFPSPIYPMSEEWLDTVQSRWLNIPETDDWQRRVLVHQDTVLHSPSSFAQSTIAAHHYQMGPDIDQASALSFQSKNIIREGGGAFDPHCILDSICIPSPSYKSTVDSSPSSISPPCSASRNQMAMMPSITKDSILDTDLSPTNPWDASSNPTQRAFSGFCGLEPLTSVKDLPDTLFESYFHSPPPPDFTIQPLGVPESSSSREDTHLVSVPEGDPSQTSNRHQESHSPQEGGAELCEDTDLEYYGHGEQSFGYLTPSPSTLKRRRRLSAKETAFLVSQFCINVKPTAQERQVFAKHLNLDRRRIQVWFQNRRAKLKREETFAHNE